MAQVHTTAGALLKCVRTFEGRLEALTSEDSHLAQLRDEYDLLQWMITEEDVTDQSVFQRYGRVHSELDNLRTMIESLDNAVEFGNLAVREKDGELRDLALGELEDAMEPLLDYSLGLKLVQPYDHLPCQITINAHQPNPELLEILVLGYVQFATQHDKLDLDVISDQSKSWKARVDGPYAYGLFRGETGRHMYRRAEKSKVYVNNVSVLVEPILEEDFSGVNPDELRVEYLSGSTKGGQHANKCSTNVRITHIPTGISVRRAGRSQSINYDCAVREIENRVEDFYRKANQVLDLNSEKRVRTYQQINHQVIDDALGTVPNGIELFQKDMMPFIMAHHGVTWYNE